MGLIKSAAPKWLKVFKENPEKFQKALLGEATVNPGYSDRAISMIQRHGDKRKAWNIFAQHPLATPIDKARYFKHNGTLYKFDIDSNNIKEKLRKSYIDFMSDSDPNHLRMNDYVNSAHSKMIEGFKNSATHALSGREADGVFPSFKAVHSNRPVTLIHSSRNNLNKRSVMRSPSAMLYDDVPINHVFAYKKGESGKINAIGGREFKRHASVVRESDIIYTPDLTHPSRQGLEYRIPGVKFIGGLKS